ncbi:MAG: hypothetical protein LBI02_03390 [Opitutaceae bacterium]|jgi:hypothetical protein|nr:hypothetical protein [Opitutaceae bacterium]
MKNSRGDAEGRSRGEQGREERGERKKNEKENEDEERKKRVRREESASSRLCVSSSWFRVLCVFVVKKRTPLNKG